MGGGPGTREPAGAENGEFRLREFIKDKLHHHLYRIPGSRPNTPGNSSVDAQRRLCTMAFAEPSQYPLCDADRGTCRTALRPQGMYCFWQAAGCDAIAPKNTFRSQIRCSDRRSCMTQSIRSATQPDCGHRKMTALPSWEGVIAAPEAWVPKLFGQSEHPHHG